MHGSKQMLPPCKPSAPSSSPLERRTSVLCEFERVVVTPAPHASGAQEWIIYPRHGQPPAQLEADRLACQQWAVTVPGAWGNPAVLRRAEAACLDGRGYTVR